MKPHFDDKPKVRWQKLFLHGSLWLSAEILLGSVGLDNLADYSEFLLQSRVSTQLMEVVSSWMNLM
ncbi:MAG TPA: hypothetical protein V6D06_12690 [Trichocoleus sp.]